MDETAFEAFLKRGGRSDGTVARVVRYTGEFERFLADAGRTLDDAEPEHLESFVAAIESEPGTTANIWLWAINYYYEFSEDAVMEHAAVELRADRIKHRPFRLYRFRGIDPSVVKSLAAVGVTNVDQLLERARTPADRRGLAADAGIPDDVVTELVQLSDLARIVGLKGIRARLYHSAGITTVAQLAGWEIDALVERLASYVASAGFDGIAPVRGEVEHAVTTARKLPSVVEW
jgi:predicted flap endonuclease-1-like 5' DNA nuclease